MYADADLAAPGRAWPQFLQVAQPGMADAVGERAPRLRPGFEQQADGPADLDRAGPVSLAQVVQLSCGNFELWAHWNGVCPCRLGSFHARRNTRSVLSDKGGRPLVGITAGLPATAWYDAQLSVVVAGNRAWRIASSSGPGSSPSGPCLAAWRGSSRTAGPQAGLSGVGQAAGSPQAGGSARPAAGGHGLDRCRRRLFPARAWAALAVARTRSEP